MKKACLAAIIMLFVMSFSLLSYAAEGQSSLMESRKFIGVKFMRGLKNVALGWTEIPKRMVDVYADTKNPFWAIGAGAYQGSIKAVVRTASGACDMVTCPIKSDEGPFIDPEIDVSSK